MSKLRVVLLQPDFSRPKSVSYQHDFTVALGRKHRVFRYGRGLDGYDPKHTLDDVLCACPFDPDLICFGAGWEVEDPRRPEFDPHPNIRVAESGIATAMVLNKEYKKLDRKLAFVRDNGIRMVFTVHHDYGKWSQETGVPFVQFPFGVDETRFRDYGEPKRYAVGFSGSTHGQWTDVRERIKERLFVRWPVKRRTYWGTRVYWSEWGRMRGLRPPAGEAYGRLLNSSKSWISTPSAIDIVGPRFFEVLAAKTLLLCSRSPVYGDLLTDQENCVMFEPDLEDFDHKLFSYLRRDEDREAIVRRGHAHVLENHTWERRIEQFTSAVKTVL